MADRAVPAAAREAVRQKLEQIRGLYAARLGEKLSELDAALEQSRRSGDGRDLKLALRLAHNVAGTASVVGLRRVGLAALEFEKLLDSMVEHAGPLPDAALAAAARSLHAAAAEELGLPQP